MKIKLIDVNFKGSKPGDKISVSKGEGKYLIDSGNAVEIKTNKKDGE